MLAEYASIYGVPDPDMPWPLFMALIERGPRFEARALLRQMDGTAWAIGRAFSDDHGKLMSVREQLERTAYPWTEERDPFVIRGSDAGT